VTQHVSPDRLAEVVRYVAQAHGEQTRKGSDIAYVSHLLAVAALVMEAGGTETQVLAALLHDTVEDCGGLPRLDDVREKFGADVAEIVRACSDSLVTDPTAKEEWRTRKERYLAGLHSEPPDVLLVSLADKLHNATVTLRDLRRDGAAAFEKFNGKRDGTQWYYRRLVTVFDDWREELSPGGRELLDELRAVVEQIDAY